MGKSSLSKLQLELLSGTHVGSLLTGDFPALTIDDGSTEFEALFGADLNTANSVKEFSQKIFNAKQAAASCYAKALIGPLDCDQQINESVGRFWSRFADWSLNRTLSYVWHVPAITRHIGTPPKPGEPMPGVFVLGLGKLGGQDLNYSSDVDLITFFDARKFIIPGEFGKTEIIDRAMKTLTQLLAGTHGPRSWRVDWRLRPDPSVTGLAMSAEAGLDFYFFHAQPWRRLAMMKARVVAGDMDAGNEFLAELEPFIWRKTLDFRAMEEISTIKQRIREEHPDLDQERAEETPLTTLEHFHTKLGSGGIREIEFIANALQLVWGGRQLELRTPHTLTTLKKLEELKHLPPKDAQKLRRAYGVLRGLENRIQLLGDEHVHSFPGKSKDDKITRQRLLTLCGETDFGKISRLITSLRKNVNGLFGTVFVHTENGANDNDDDKDLRLRLSSGHLKTLTAWRNGFSLYGISQDATSRMRPLYQALCSMLAAADDCETVLVTLDTFFRSLPPGGQYLRLLAENPALVSDILTPLIDGGAMGNLLRHSPHVVDMLVQRRGLTFTDKEERLALLARIVSQRDYEAQLEAMRAYVNEMLYLAYLQVRRREISLNDARILLSEIAIESLQATIDLVSREMDVDEAAICVVGFGKLGMAEMMPQSDLDIVFLAHGGSGLELDDVQNAHRLATRIKTALSAEMRGGIVYEIDTRLRPSGASGAPTVRLSTFRSHQMKRAKTWEHIAMVPARFVVGANFARVAFEEVRHDVLTRPRDQKILVRDAHSMLDLLREHRIGQGKDGTLSVKLMAGGLMEVEYLIAYLVLKWGAQHPQLATLPFSQLTTELEQIDPTLIGIKDALTFLQDVQFCERLYGWTGKEIRELNLPLSALTSKPGEFSDTLKVTGKLVSKLVREQIIRPSGLGASKLAIHVTKPVKWAD